MLVKVIYDAVSVIDNYRRHRLFYHIQKGHLSEDIKFEGGLANHDDALNLIIYDGTVTQTFVDGELVEIGKRYRVKPSMVRTLLLYYMIVNRDRFRVYSDPSSLYMELIEALTVGDESDCNPDYEFNGRLTHSVVMGYLD